MKETIILINEDATKDLAAKLSTIVDSGTVIFLQGELGAGKTTFVRNFIQSLGFEGRVKSPTFTIVEEYDLKNGLLYHFDLYRLSHPEELEFIGIFEYFSRNALILIEWPEKGKGYLAKPDLICDFKILDNSSERRELLILAASKRGEELLSKLKGRK